MAYKVKINCRADFFNYLEMYKQGLVKAKGVIKEINRIKNLNYDKAIINEISSDRKTINVNYLAEADEGSAARVGSVDVIVKSVAHNQSEPDEHGNVSFITSDIVTNKAVTAGATTFDLVKIPSIYKKMNITEEEIDEILEQLQA